MFACLHQNEDGREGQEVRWSDDIKHSEEILQLQTTCKAKRKSTLSSARNEVGTRSSQLGHPWKFMEILSTWAFDAFAAAWCTQHLDSLEKFLNCGEPYAILKAMLCYVSASLSIFCEIVAIYSYFPAMYLISSHFHDFLIMPTVARLPERNHAKRLRRTDRRIQPTRPSFSWYLKSWCKTGFHMRMFGNYWSSGRISHSQNN